MLSRFVAAASIALVAIAAPLQAQIVNGGFETPVVPSGSYQIFSTGSSFNGWSVVGAQGDVAVISGAFFQNGFNFPARSGAQWLDLTGRSNSATGVQQVFNTAIGQSYDLSFWVGNVSGNIFGTTSSVNVLLNGALFMTATNTTPATTMDWQMFTSTFTASSASTTLAFINNDPNSDNSNGLDDVSVGASAPPITTTPEPGAMALIATGLVGLVPLARKRRS